MPGTVHGPGDTAMDKTGKEPVPGELAYHARRLAPNTEYKLKMISVVIQAKAGGLSGLSHWITLV